MRKALEAGRFELVLGDGRPRRGRRADPRGGADRARAGQRRLGGGRRGRLTVELDTELDDELLLEGRVCDLIRKLNEMRKEAGLEVTDRIRVRLPRAKAELCAHGDWIKAEVLAVEIARRRRRASRDREGLRTKARRAREVEMAKFRIQPHVRLQEWVADENGFFVDEGLDYEFDSERFAGSSLTTSPADASVSRPITHPSLHGAERSRTWPKAELATCLPRVPLGRERRRPRGAGKMWGKAYSGLQLRNLRRRGLAHEEPSDLANVKVGVGFHSAATTRRSGAQALAIRTRSQ